MGLSCKFSLKPIQWHGEIMGNHGKSQWKSQWKIQVRGALSPAAAFTATPGAWRWALFFFLNEQTMTNIYLLIYDTYIWHISCKWHIWCLYISFDIYIYMIYIYIYLSLSLSIVYITISYYIYRIFIYEIFVVCILVYLAIFGCCNSFVYSLIHSYHHTNTYIFIYTY